MSYATNANLVDALQTLVAICQANGLGGLASVEEARKVASSIEGSSETSPPYDRATEEALAVYDASLKEYDRDFMRDDWPAGSWEAKYGTNLHSSELGRLHAMKQAIIAANTYITRGKEIISPNEDVETLEKKAVKIAEKLSERSDFNLRIRDLWQDSAKDLARYIIARMKEPKVSRKCFIIDYPEDSGNIDTKLFDYDSQQTMAETFCNKLKENGKPVNIKVREVGVV